MKPYTRITLTSLIIATAFATAACSNSKPSDYRTTQLASRDAIIEKEEDSHIVKLNLQPSQDEIETNTDAEHREREVSLHTDVSESEAPEPEVIDTEIMASILMDADTTEPDLMLEPAPEEPHIVDTSRPAQTQFRFEFNKSELDENNSKILKQHGEFLAQNPAIKITINGHADNQGDAAYNEHLSLQRAKNVAALLQQQGVDQDQIEIFSWGAADPVPSATHHRENRRVELKYTEEFYVKNEEI